MLGKTTENAHIVKVYSTIEMNIFSYSNALQDKLYVGGLIVDAYGGEMVACMYNSKGIMIDDSF